MPPKLFVSITSQPTSRKLVCTFSIASGRVYEQVLEQFSKCGPPQSSIVRSGLEIVPIAPSKTMIRSLRVSRKAFGS